MCSFRMHVILRSQVNDLKYHSILKLTSLTVNVQLLLKNTFKPTPDIIDATHFGRILGCKDADAIG
jgi:hypothetical protein